MDFLFLAAGLLLGGVIGYLAARRRPQPVSEQGNQHHRVSELEQENTVQRDRLTRAEETFRQQKSDLEAARSKAEQLHAEVGRWQTEYRNVKEKLDSQGEEMEMVQKKLSVEFENLANQILKQNTKEFNQASQKSLEGILTPLREKISAFEKKVEETHREELRDKASLKQELRNLIDLNQKISQEANNLTNALKGDNKKQGNWGEVILERVLERSGLVKGQEYVTQFATENVDGQKIQPDVIVHLPDDKHIIIDAKVSLVHYDQYVNASEEAEKTLALKAHLASLRNHIKGLGDKNYQTAANLSTPDFVLLFVPIEASFSVAIQTDLDLFGYAWDRKVVLVSPTTLLATLRTISSIWKQERQSKNVQQIAKEGGLLYDKFVGFLEDMETIQKGLERSQSAYDAAMNKLQTGKGNLIGKAVKLRKLGAKTNKDIPEHLIEDNDQLPQNTHA